MIFGGIFMSCFTIPEKNAEGIYEMVDANIKLEVAEGEYFK